MLLNPVVVDKEARKAGHKLASLHENFAGQWSFHPTNPKPAYENSVVITQFSNDLLIAKLPSCHHHHLCQVILYCSSTFIKGFLRPLLLAVIHMKTTLCKPSWTSVKLAHIPVVRLDNFPTWLQTGKVYCFGSIKAKHVVKNYKKKNFIFRHSESQSPSF